MANLDNLIDNYTTGGTIDANPYSFIGEDDPLRNIADSIMGMLKEDAPFPELSFLEKDSPLYGTTHGGYSEDTEKISFDPNKSPSEKTAHHELIHFLDDMYKPGKSSSSKSFKTGEDIKVSGFASGDIGLKKDVIKKLIDMVYTGSGGEIKDSPSDELSKPQEFLAYTQSDPDYWSNYPKTAAKNIVSNDFKNFDIRDLVGYLGETKKAKSLYDTLLNKYLK